MSGDCQGDDPWRTYRNQGQLADHVAGQIEKLVVEGHLEPGTKLPSEAELARQFEVSRTVIREAVQIVLNMADNLTTGG